MQIYTVHEPLRPSPDLAERAARVVFIREGFTWWGFLFSPFWLAANMLWFELLGLIVLSGVLAALLTALGLSEQGPGIANLLFMLVIGFEGNNLKRWRWERKGYGLVASVAGRTRDECEQRFFETWLPYAAAKTNLPPSAPNGKINPLEVDSWRGTTVIGTMSEA